MSRGLAIRQSGRARSICRPRARPQFRIREDFNGEEQEGLGIYQVTQKNGERWSAARGYIHPLHEQPRPICASKPTRMPPASCSRASARSASNTGKASELKQIRAAARGDPVRAGAFQTPQLLMLSGVGDAAALAQTRHRHGAPFARRRTEPAGPSGLRVRLHLGRAAFCRPVVRRHRARSSRASRNIAASGADR